MKHITRKVLIIFHVLWFHLYWYENDINSNEPNISSLNTWSASQEKYWNNITHKGMTKVDWVKNVSATKSFIKLSHLGSNETAIR
jgi:hypothetical protein